MKFIDNISLEEFGKIYSTELNSWENFKLFLQDGLIDLTDFNILIGASNLTENDYTRFGNLAKNDYARFKSTSYSLFIDLENSTNISRQFNMYTIQYKDILPDILSNNIPKNIADSIMLDNDVSYFAPINYFQLANNILRPGGKMCYLWQPNHMTFYRFKYDELYSTYYDLHRNCLFELKRELEPKFNIKIDNDCQMIYFLDIFFDKQYSDFTLTPQVPFIFMDNKWNEYKTDLIDKFITFISNKFPNFRINHKTFTYFSVADCPMPIRYDPQNKHNINVYINEINQIINSLDENLRIMYINKQYNFDQLANHIIDKCDNDSKLLDEFTKERHYIEIIKR